MSCTRQFNVQFSVPMEQLLRKEQIPVIGQSFLLKLRGAGLEEVGVGVGERNHSTYKILTDSQNATRIFTACSTAFPEHNIPLSRHSWDKGPSGKSDACLVVKTSHAEAGYKRPDTNYFAVFWVIITCNLVRACQRHVTNERPT